MAATLIPGGHLALLDRTVVFGLAGPYTVYAVVLGADGRPGSDADVVVAEQPSTPGVRLVRGRVAVTPGLLRPGAVGVGLIAEPAAPRGAGPLLAATLSRPDGRLLARVVPPVRRLEQAMLLALVHRRAEGWWLSAPDGPPGGPGDLPPEIQVEADVDGTGRTAGPASAVVVATNAERARHGLPALSPDPRLDRAALAHSHDMARRAFFAHSDPDGGMVGQRVLACGYPYRVVAENIAAGQRAATEVVRGWMASPGHRANILHRDVVQIGVGRVEGGEYGVYWTQVFGTPR